MIKRSTMFFILYNIKIRVYRTLIWKQKSFLSHKFFYMPHGFPFFCPPVTSSEPEEEVKEELVIKA